MRLDPARETLVVHGLTTQRAVAPLGDPVSNRRFASRTSDARGRSLARADETRSFHASTARRSKAGAFRGPDLGQQRVAVCAFRNARAGANRAGEPRGIRDLIERLRGIDAEHPADLLEISEDGVDVELGRPGRQRALIGSDLFLEGLGFLAKLVSCPLEVFAETFDGVQARGCRPGPSTSRSSSC